MTDKVVFREALIKKEYPVRLSTLGAELLNENLDNKGGYESVYKTNSDEGVILYSTNKDITGKFNFTESLAKYSKYRGNFLIKQEKGIPKEHKVFSKLREGFEDTMSSGTMYSYAKNMIHPVIDNKPGTISKNYESISYKIEGDDIYEWGTQEYEDSNGVELVVTLPQERMLKRVDDYTVVTREKLLGLSNGFYMVRPKVEDKAISISKYKGAVEIGSDRLVELTSNYKVSYSGWGTKNYQLLPNSDIAIKLSTELTNPFTSLDDLDPSKEYIVARINTEASRELSDTSGVLTYLYKISSSGSPLDSDDETLFRSHPEYLRSYVVIPSEAKVTLEYKEGSNLVTKSFEIYSSDFRQLYDNLTDVKHININK